MIAGHSTGSVPRVTIFDTSIVTDNLGDEIIMDSVFRELKILAEAFLLIRVPTHDTLGPTGRENLQRSSYSFVGGTNILCAQWWHYRQWKIGISDFWRIGHPLLLGVGWHKYQRPTDIFTAYMLRHLLSKKLVHSVRDDYTVKRLERVGVRNVINTACPTMWNLTPELCKSVPTAKAKNAVITVTCYIKDPAIDRAWVQAVMKEYENVYFWPQMADDYSYFKELTQDRVKIIPSNLQAYDSLLQSEDVDYIGTRLHGGIRALQFRRRTLILEVDSRATEIGRDTGLSTAPRRDVGKIQAWIKTPAPADIRLPTGNIELYRAQLKTIVGENSAMFA